MQWHSKIFLANLTTGNNEWRVPSMDDDHTTSTIPVQVTSEWDHVLRASLPSYLSYLYSDIYPGSVCRTFLCISYASFCSRCMWFIIRTRGLNIISIIVVNSIWVQYYSHELVVARCVHSMALALTASAPSSSPIWRSSSRNFLKNDLWSTGEQW